MLKILLKQNKYILNNNEKSNYHDENQYLNLIQQIIDNGTWEEGRNGKTLSIFGGAMHFSLENNIIPILTTKKVAWKTCLRELLWFISGKTSNKILKDKNVNIWNANSSREFLDSRELYNRNEDDLGPIYGFQWRHFNAHYNTCDDDYSNNGIDQLIDVINTLKDPIKRTSRRMIITAWNPCQLNDMALPPCHVLMQFNVHNNNKLSCNMYQRSVDVMLGQPFNIASYCFLTHLLAKHCDLEASDFYYFMGNCHIYEEHIESAKIQIQRTPYVFASLNIINKKDNINDYNENDFILNNYKYHEAIKMKMIA
jgi:thymidylate synthase